MCVFSAPGKGVGEGRGEACALLGYSAAKHSGMMRWMHPLWQVRLSAVPGSSLQGPRPPSAPAVSCASCVILGEGVRKNKRGRKLPVQITGLVVSVASWPTRRWWSRSAMDARGPHLSLPRALGWPPRAHHQDPAEIRCLALSNHLCVGSGSSSGEAKPTDKHSDLPTASLTRVPPS